MQFTLTTLALALSAFSAASAAPALSTRDVWDPRVVYPNAETVWTLGSTHNVTWDTSNAPKQVSNGAALYLRKGDTTIDYPLARGFDLHSGREEITVPRNFTPGSDYRIVLFGDSGNFSKKFTIKK